MGYSPAGYRYTTLRDATTIVADAGMFSGANKKAIVDSGLHYILSVKTPNLPEVIAEWKKDNPGTDYEHGQVWRQPSCTDGRKSGARIQ